MLTFIVFLFFCTNLILRLNDFVSGFQGFPLAEALIPIVVILWLVFDKKDFSSPTDYLLPAFFFCVTAGSILVWPGGTWGTIHSLIPWLAVYFLSANLIRTPKRLDIMCAVLVGASLILVLHCVQQVLAWDGSNDATGLGWTGATVIRGRTRYVGVLNDPNDLALYFVMMLPLVLQLCARWQSRWRRFSGYLLCMPLLYGIYTTNSRGGMLAAGVVLSAYTFRRFARWKASAACLLVLVALVAFGPSRVRDESAGDEESVQGRISAWQTGFQVFKAHPVLGVGKDRFMDYYPLTAHNSFVLCFAENGLLGFLMWFGAGYFVLVGLHRVIARAPPRTASHRQAVALFDGLLGFYVAGFFLSRTYYIMLPVFLGLGVACYRLAQESQDDWGHPDFEDAEMFSADFDTETERLPEYSLLRILRAMPRMILLALAFMAFIYIVVKIN